MYLESDKDLWDLLESTTAEKFETNLFFVGKDMQGSVDTVLFQHLLRSIDGEDVSIPALRNILIKEEFRNQKIFSRLILSLEKFGKPFMVDDVVNHKVLDPFFKKRGYRRYHYEKNGHTIDCWIFNPPS